MKTGISEGVIFKNITTRSREIIPAKYTRHTSSCMCCVCVRSPQSLTYVSSWGFTRLSPSCNSNYLEYSFISRK
ncbi:hypothetical protein DWH66_03130 [Escherichia coli]|nr:hypothetical protein [Escherichia coli]EFO3740964.1 hypothetical protein [Escherichia coli]